MKRLIAILVALCMASPALAQTATPTPPASPSGLGVNFVTDAPNQPDFTWMESSGATDYDLQVFDHENHEVYEAELIASIICGVSICAYLSPVAFSFAVYSWRVTAANGGGYGLPSATAYFSIENAPTPIPLANGDIVNGLSQADQQVGNLPSDLSAPDGSPILPNENGSQLFSYIKWLVAPATTSELFGPFASTFANFGYFLAGQVALVGIYIAIYVIAYIVRWLIYMARLIMQFAQTIGSITGSALGWLFSFLGL